MALGSGAFHARAPSRHIRPVRIRLKSDAERHLCNTSSILQRRRLRLHSLMSSQPQTPHVLRAALKWRPTRDRRPASAALRLNPKKPAGYRHRTSPMQRRATIPPYKAPAKRCGRAAAMPHLACGALEKLCGKPLSEREGMPPSHANCDLYHVVRQRRFFSTINFHLFAQHFVLRPVWNLCTL